MNLKRRGASTPSFLCIDMPATEDCRCSPLSSWHEASREEQEEIDVEQIIPITPELNSRLRTTLLSFFPCPTSLSVLLLHVFQLEHIHIAPQSAVLHKRLRYHAPGSFLDQVLVNVRRTIRDSDQILAHDGTGAAIIFPGVDQHGAYIILERVHASISLLQAETVIPPLKRETDILLGIGSYPEPGSSLEQLLYHTGLLARRLTLRPAITTQLWSAKPTSPEETSSNRDQNNDNSLLFGQVPSSSIPFMQLPTRLPGRLKQLIPHHLALELRCAPVGRDHNCLTVALADPTDTHALQQLRATTGMTIFPVSCEITALNTLLANEW